MGRPKGSKSKPLLDPENILPKRQTENDENENPIEGSVPTKTKKKTGIKTRNKSQNIQAYTNLVGPAIEFFPKSKLPQNKVLLQRYMGLRDKFPKEKLSTLVNILYMEMVQDTWVPARIPTDTKAVCKYTIKCAVQKFINFKHRTYKGKEDHPKNISECETFLTQLCDLSPPNLKDLLSKSSRLNKVWEDDWQFYLNMCEPKQVGCVGGRDHKLALKEGEKTVRMAKDEKKKVKEDVKKRKLSEVVTGAEYDDGADEEEPNQDPDIVFNNRIRKKAKIVLEIDPNDIVKQTTSTTDRLGLSNRQTAMMLASVVKAGGGDVAKVKVSKSGVQRQRKKIRAMKGKKIMSSFVQSDKGYILHYDTKLVNPKGRDQEDRAAVLYSGGLHKQPYLLGIPKFLSSSGKDVETGVVNEIEKYKIPLEECIGTCYDTTASNSGYKSGAHFRLEKRIGHAILELECRKHVYELHVTHANKVL